MHQYVFLMLGPEFAQGFAYAYISCVEGLDVTETPFCLHIERVADDTGDGTYNHLAQNQKSSNGASESVGEVSLLDSTSM